MEPVAEFWITQVKMPRKCSSNIVQEKSIDLWQQLLQLADELLQDDNELSPFIKGLNSTLMSTALASVVLKSAVGAAGNFRTLEHCTSFSFYICV